ncbi:RecQ family ATP-dependent DNA helicase [Caldalkalibacillus salinus]|uniref:RecQ family ATP-dependent DNA helicase n=1 Tax=Caldalkalibacillus salinus TaxID=2803787 RepID=UPI001923ED82|nr:RecQ family ATP-dependent DNA helicase [Caldalkalibacillus salinus]
MSTNQYLEYNHGHQVSDELMQQTLQKVYGYHDFREDQASIIRCVISGRDTLVIKTTGGGKSLCYQIPSLLLPAATVVISPLVSLMEDQVRDAHLHGRKDTVAIHGHLSGAEKGAILAHIHQYNLIYVSPEGIQNDTIMRALSRRRVSLFVVDEAHCISQWGHDFRQDYLRLAHIRKKLGQPTCMALTATATTEVKNDILFYLDMVNPKSFISSVNRENLYHYVQRVENEQQKITFIYDLLNRRQDAGLVYCSSRAKTEELTQYFQAQGITSIAYYHGGVNPEERRMIQEQFQQGELKVIFATNAFGMGINKPDIRYVIHYHFPSQLEAYVQEMGRCSRDGKSGVSIVLAQAGDEQIPYHFLEQEYTSPSKVQLLFRYLKQMGYKTPSNEEEMQKVAYSLDFPLQALDTVLFQLKQVLADSRLTAGNIDELEIEVQARMDQLRLKRSKKIATMYHWLQLGEAECRRSFILHYFSERLKHDQSEWCCDLCGYRPEWLEIDVDTCHSIRPFETPHGDRLHWSEALDQLLPPSHL